MYEQLISFETAKLAKEKGWRCSTYNYTHGYSFYERDVLIMGNKSSGSNSLYENICDAPTQSLLAKWLRDVHKINVSAIRDNDCWIPEITDFANGNKDISIGHSWYNSYEEALEVGLFEALKLI